MQESVNEKAVGFILRRTKITADMIRDAMRRFISMQGKTKNNKGKEIYKGKQSLKHLKAATNGNVESIEITDKNIRAFDCPARKYGVDYSIKKDKSVNPPRWLVFFKGKDADSLQAAFREFTAKKLKKQERPSVREQLKKFKEQAKNRVKTKTIKRDRGRDR